MKWIALVILNAKLLSLYFQLTCAELFTAIVDLQPLLRTGEEIMKSLDKYFKMEEVRLEKLRWLRSEYGRLHETANNTDVNQFLSNPVNAFLLIKRLTADWQTTKGLVEGIDSQAVIADINMKGLTFPMDEDLNGAAAALLRLQDTYLLNTSQLARGVIKGAATASSLTAGDCFELGRQAFLKEDFSHAVPWFQEALQQIANEGIKSISKISILEHLAYSFYMIDNISSAATATEEILKVDPSNADAETNFKFYEKELRSIKDLLKGDSGGDSEGPATDSDYSEPIDPEPVDGLSFVGDGRYQSLCRGEKIKTPLEESRLRCRYTSNNSSFLLLQPVKEEELNLDPRIVVYHKILPDVDAEVFKELSVSSLFRAKVVSHNGMEVPSANRVSKCTWLDDDAHPRVARASRLISEVTGLSIDGAEDLHVITYGIGGHYLPHLDFRLNEPQSEPRHSSYVRIGKRIATWIYYLSDIDAGGSTVFPEIGVEVKAEKGSACFWFNLMRSGEGDLRTLHAACPVLVGTKWVANKWLHEKGQEFRRSCSLNPKE